ncbi:MAG: 4-hydroxybenzoate 3-monooxygenase, partial [Polyangiaceae bacterium]
LAMADAHVLAGALAAYFERGDGTALERYSETCLRRVWRAQHFSGWLTSLLHRFPEHDAYQQRLQIAQLRYIVGSRAARTSLAENYVGLPLDWADPLG